MKTINANETFGLEIAKEIFNLPVENGILLMPSTMFVGFGSMLYAVANPISNCDQEAQQYIISKCKELNIKGAKIVNL